MNGLLRRNSAVVLPYLVLGGSQLAIGAAAIFARYALGAAGPLGVAAARLTIAAAVLLLIATMRRRASKPRTARERAIFIGAGFALALHFATWIWSLEYTTVAISTLLVTTTPIWTSLYDALVRGRRPSRLTLLGFAGGAAGLVMVVGFNRTPPPHPGHAVLGAVLALAGSLAIGVYLLLVREIRDDFGTRAIVTRTYGWSALFLIAGAAGAHQPPPPLAATGAWGGIIAMGVFSQLLGHTGLNAALRWFTPSAISFATLLEPVFAAVLALALFGEALTPAAVAGGIVLLAAIGIVLREERRTLDGSGLLIGPVQ